MHLWCTQSHIGFFHVAQKGTERCKENPMKPDTGIDGFILSGLQQVVVNNDSKNLDLFPGLFWQGEC